MDSKRIESLLEKYWKAETSLEEEQQLREYFTGSQVPEHLKETASLFRYFQSNKKKSLNDISFDADIIRQVNAPQRSKVRSLVYNAMRIAAGLAVLAVATWIVRDQIREATPQAIVDTYEDPKLAFEETKKALRMISKSFGTAEEQAKKINLFNEAQEEIQNQQKDQN